MRVFPERYECCNCNHKWDGLRGRQTCSACGSIEVEWTSFKSEPAPVLAAPCGFIEVGAE